VAISFHSLEDRIVKRVLRQHAATDPLPRRLPVKTRDIAPPRLKLIGRAQRAGASEIAANPRARSAVMRVAERIDRRSADAGRAS
jgi:16S rRNA (cytosine1402-N4)-methyltransferase